MTQGVGLLTAWEHAKSVMTLCFFVGIILHVLDCTLGVRAYRFLYNLMHGKGDEMPAHVRKGFLYRQSSRRMVYVVTVIEVWYILKLIGAYGLLGLDYFSEAFVWIMLPFALPAGFYLAGPWVFRMLAYFNPFIHKIDELNSSETVDIGGGLKRLFQSVGSWFPSRGKASPPPAPAPAAPVPPAPAEPQVNWRDRLKSYTGRE